LRFYFSGNFVKKLAKLPSSEPAVNVQHKRLQSLKNKINKAIKITLPHMLN